MADNKPRDIKVDNNEPLSEPDEREKLLAGNPTKALDDNSPILISPNAQPINFAQDDDPEKDTVAKHDNEAGRPTTPEPSNDTGKTGKTAPDNGAGKSTPPNPGEKSQYEPTPEESEEAKRNKTAPPYLSALRNLATDLPTLTFKVYSADDNYKNPTTASYNLLNPGVIPFNSIVLSGEAAKTFKIKMEKAGPNADAYEIATEILQDKTYQNKEAFQPNMNDITDFQQVLSAIKLSEIKQEIIEKVKADQVKLDDIISNTPNEKTKQDILTRKIRLNKEFLGEFDKLTPRNEDNSPNYKAIKLADIRVMAGQYLDERKDKSDSTDLNRNNDRPTKLTPQPQQGKSTELGKKNEMAPTM